MKKLLIVFSALMGAGLICFFTVSLLLNIKESFFAPPDISSVESLKGGYYLTLHEGFVAIKNADDGSLVRKFGLHESMLSDYDRGLLTEGVFYISLDDALLGAEDFTG